MEDLIAVGVTETPFTHLMNQTGLSCPSGTKGNIQLPGMFSNIIVIELLYIATGRAGISHGYVILQWRKLKQKIQKFIHHI